MILPKDEAQAERTGILNALQEMDMWFVKLMILLAVFYGIGAWFVTLLPPIH